MSKAWSHLPNAHHIDWVLESLDKNPKLWTKSRDVAGDEIREARRVAWNAAAADLTGAWFAAKDALNHAARNTVNHAARNTVSDTAREAAWFTIAGLLAWDNCDQFLSMSYERLKVWAVLSEDPRAILLLPMVYVREKLNEQSLVTLV